MAQSLKRFTRQSHISQIYLSINHIFCVLQYGHLFSNIPPAFIRVTLCTPLSNRLFSQIPVFNDELPLKILSGSVVIKSNIKEIRGSTVEFEDDSVLEKVGRRYIECFSTIGQHQFRP